MALRKFVSIPLTENHNMVAVPVLQYEFMSENLQSGAAASRPLSEARLPWILTALCRWGYWT